MTEVLFYFYQRVISGTGFYRSNDPTNSVWDMFRAHITDEVKAEVAKKKTDMCVIPGGLTSVLQPLDVCINKPFKD